MLTNKQRLQLAITQYRKWLKSIGLNLNKNGRVISRHKGFDMPNYKMRDSIPTSDRVVGDTFKRTYATKLPAGKTIGIAYNKGAYQVVDSSDFKTMGRKIQMLQNGIKGAFSMGSDGLVLTQSWFGDLNLNFRTPLNQ